MLLYYGVAIIYTSSPEVIGNGLIEIASCFKQGSNAISVFICGIFPRDDISSINHLVMKETNNILKSSSSIKHINFIDQDVNWIQVSGSLKPDLFYFDKLHLVEKGNLILAKSLYTLVKNHYGSWNNYQLSKTYKSVTAFSLNNADFPTLTPLSPHQPDSDCISASPYKSVLNSSIKSV